MSPPQTLKVACVQMHWAKPIEHNLQRTLHYVRAAREDGCRVVLFPETNLTSYYFPYATGLSPETVQRALDQTRQAAAENGIWVICGTLRRTADRFLNLSH